MTVNELLSEMSCSTILKHIPLQVVSEQLAKLTLCSQRQRSLPAESIIYLLVTMALHSDISILENLRILLEPIRRLLGIQNPKIPVGSAIVRARKRLGFDVFKNIFDAISKPCARKETKECFWKGYRLVAVDGTTHNVQDTEANRQYFGVHSNAAGKNLFPQLKATALMECGTKVFFGMEIGRYNSSEQVQYEKLINKLSQDMLLIADRVFFSFNLWRLSSQKAGALIWRVKKDLNLKAQKRFKDGSYLAEITPSWHHAKKNPCIKKQKLTVRVIEFKPVFSDGTEGESVRLITTILDPQKATALEIAEIYPHRWLIEEGFSEIKRYLGRRDKILRSQTPEFVIQEFYGFLLAHYAVRAMMCQSAKDNNIAPNDLSFTGSLRVIIRKIAFFPSAKQ